MWDLDDTRQEGFFHKMLQYSHASFIREVSSLRAWASQCQIQNNSFNCNNQSNHYSFFSDPGV